MSFPPKEVKDVQGMDTIDNGFNIYCYFTICSYINMVSHYHKFISIVLVKNNARELVKCESLKTLFYFLGKIYLFSIFLTESWKSVFGNFFIFFNRKCKTKFQLNFIIFYWASFIKKNHITSIWLVNILVIYISRSILDPS